jgi:hypothetical protein
MIMGEYMDLLGAMFNVSILFFVIGQSRWLLANKKKI